jgi:hypothetical protein
MLHLEKEKMLKKHLKQNKNQKNTYFTNKI